MAGAFRLGVDYGTSNTVAVLRWPDGRTRPLLFDASPQLPSAAYAGPDGSLLVGRDALASARVQPDRFERNPKRRVDDGTVLLGDREVPVVDLIAAALAQVRTEAERIAGGPIPQVVLTHPVAWGRRRRGMLAHAAHQAGLVDARFVPEPVAAASYFVKVLQASLPAGDSLIVYDLGAGTFDATVVRRTANNLEVLATDGVDDAGGLDVDAAIVGYLRETLTGRDDAWERLCNPRTSADRRLHDQLWEDVRGAKEMLSRAPSAMLHVPVIETDVPVGREQLDQFARPILDRTVEATRAAMQASGVGTGTLAGVFLVGGSSRIPLVATLLHRTLGTAPTALEQPEIVVAEGALFAPPGALTRADPTAYEPPPTVQPAASAPPPTSAVPTSAVPYPTHPAAAPVSAPPVSAPPVSAPPMTGMPVSAPAASAPPVSAPPGAGAPVSVPVVASGRATVRTAAPPPADGTKPPPAGEMTPPPAGGIWRDLPARPIVLTLPAGLGYTLAASPEPTTFLAIAGHLQLFRAPARLAEFLRDRASLARLPEPARWAALPPVRPDQLSPGPAASAGSSPPPARPTTGRSTATTAAAGSASRYATARRPPPPTWPATWTWPAACSPRWATPARCSTRPGSRGPPARSRPPPPGPAGSTPPPCTRVPPHRSGSGSPPGGGSSSTTSPC